MNYAEIPSRNAKAAIFGQTEMRLSKIVEIPRVSLKR